MAGLRFRLMFRSLLWVGLQLGGRQSSRAQMELLLIKSPMTSTPTACQEIVHGMILGVMTAYGCQNCVCAYVLTESTLGKCQTIICDNHDHDFSTLSCSNSTNTHFRNYWNIQIFFSGCFISIFFRASKKSRKGKLIFYTYFKYLFIFYFFLFFRVNVETSEQALCLCHQHVFMYTTQTKDSLPVIRWAICTVVFHIMMS